MHIHAIQGLVLSITSIVLSLIDSTRAVSLKLRYVFRLLPAYCFGDGLLQLAFCVDDVCPKVIYKSVICFLIFCIRLNRHCSSRKG